MNIIIKTNVKELKTAIPIAKAVKIWHIELIEQNKKAKIERAK